MKLVETGCAAVFRVEADADGAPSGVAAAGALDLDDLGAHFGRQFSRERLGYQRSGRNDFHALQGAKSLGHQSFLRHSIRLMLKISERESCPVCVEAGNRGARRSIVTALAAFRARVIMTADFLHDECFN